MRPEQRRARTAQHPDVAGPPSHAGLTDEEYGRAVCASKIPYLTEQLAGNASYLLALRYPAADPLEPYDCPWCPDWHLRTVKPAVATR